MGATNTTANYNLSQFIGTDKPAWLQDYNGDMLKIDTGINAAKVAADGAQNTASAAQNDANTANNAITNTINPAISSLNTTVGNQGGAINTINSLIGNGTPTTTDQTIIGAINEINAAITEEVKATVNSGVTYTSALTTLEATYLTLTADEKLHSYILDGNQIYRINDTGFAVFSTNSGNINLVATQIINLSDHIKMIGRIESGQTQLIDQSSNTTTNALKLCVGRL